MIIEISIEEKTRWNSIVRSFPDYDVFYLNEYVSAFMKEDKKNGIPILLLYENGSERAINVVFKRDVAGAPGLSGKLPDATYYDLTSPYGYGGFKGLIHDFKRLNEVYNEYCQKNNYVCEFVRFDLFGKYSKNYDGTVESRAHNVIRSLDISLNELWMDFKQKVRKNVKRAQKNNLEILIENNGEHLQEFLNIYYSTMDRNVARKDYYFSKSFYETLNTMEENIMYFYVLHEGRFISAELVIYGAENCYSYLGGTLEEYFELRPNDFLKFEIIKWAKEKGLKNFVLGGGYGADDGIFQYKTCLAPKGIVDFYVGSKIFDNENYLKLVELRIKDNPEHSVSNYFPEYRA